MEKYELLEIEIIEFEDDDIITVSTVTMTDKYKGIKYPDEEAEE